MIINTYSGRALRTINSFVLTTECYNRKNKITENAKVKWNELSIACKEIQSRPHFKSTITNMSLNKYV